MLSGLNIRWRRPFRFCCINTHNPHPIFFHSDSATVSSAVAIPSSTASCRGAIAVVATDSSSVFFASACTRNSSCEYWRGLISPSINIQPPDISTFLFLVLTSTSATLRSRGLILETSLLIQRIIPSLSYAIFSVSGKKSA